MADFPLDISEFSEEEKHEFEEAAVYKKATFVKVGPKGYAMPPSIRKYGPSIYNFKAGPEDVMVMGFSSSGTSLVQEMLWVIFNGVDSTQERILFERVPTIETRMLVDPEDGLIRGVPNTKTEKIWEDILGATGRRLLKTELPFSFYRQPEFVESGAKFIYVIRDPKDVVAASFTGFKRLALINPRTEFGNFWRLFRNNQSVHTPFFAAIKEAWELRHKENVLFMSYIELIEETASSIEKISKFLGKAVEGDEAGSIEEYLKEKQKMEIPMGAWKKVFKEGLEDEVQDWIKENLELYSLPHDIFDIHSFENYQKP